MNTPTANRQRVSFDRAIPPSSIRNTGRFAVGKGATDWVPQWPCRKDHGHENVVRYYSNNGESHLACQVCNTEKRKKNRDANKKREAQRARERYLRRKGE